MASFLYRRIKDGPVELAFHDLESHSGTQAAHPDKTENRGWFEGHYKPDGGIELRTPTGRDTDAEDELRFRYPTFDDFVWEQFLEGTLPCTKHKEVFSVLFNHGVDQRNGM
jgi:hypothetical protein